MSRSARPRDPCLGSPPLRVTLIQPGARLHYAVPISLHRHGALERFFTDWMYRPWSVESAVSRLAQTVGSGRAAKLEGRRSPELEPCTLTYPVTTLGLRAARPLFPTADAYFEWITRMQGIWVERAGFGNADFLHGFITSVHPTTYRAARRAGLALAGDQMLAPAPTVLAEASCQVRRFAGWETPPDAASLRTRARVERESWQQLERITCASDYVRDELVAAGVDAERIRVLPYPIDCSDFRFVERDPRKSRLVVGFVGGVSLRKGAPYFFEVARRFSGANVEFVMVGPVLLHRSAPMRLPDNVKLVGGVPRSAVAAWLREFDVIYFPSTCEGSAGALMEAMATGLPVVTSPNSGTVARHGREGYIVPYDDIAGATEHLRELLEDPTRRAKMGRAARVRAEEFDLDGYGRALIAALSEVLAKT